MRNPEKTKFRFLKWLRNALLAFAALLLIGFIYLYSVSIVNPPQISNLSFEELDRKVLGKDFYTIGNNWFRKSNSGLYEMYIEGEPYQRGIINGKLSKELVIKQEVAFSDQINKMIPSKFYLNFLKYFIGWFNRHLADNVKEEYKEEIYGISQSASNDFQYIGSNYQRILNYHAAHDIGHALQSMALVGCTSFGTWNDRSADSTMIIGRNFDFYAGDKFAEDKIVAFVNPSKGYKYMSITWGGFVGVVSGMNEQGLAVTINAAKSSVPSGSATPVSLVAREILQYAKNIKEAESIAASRNMFVSESFMIASANDKKAVVIEKTPDTLDVYDPHQNSIVCANHFQSKGLLTSAQNVEQIRESASNYRYKRVVELLDATTSNTVQRTIDILRDQKGLKNANIGMGNEKAINQLITHHSIVFEPQKRIVWVSTSPWQLGKFVAYDLNKVFSMHGLQQNKEICEPTLTIAADPFLLTADYKNYLTFRLFKQKIANNEEVDIEALIKLNPQYYHSYVLAGNYEYNKHNFVKALRFYKIALTKIIATKGEERLIYQRIENCRSKVN